MNIVILPAAFEDLAQGYDFYENQQEGLGEYFQESLFSDIESLKIFAGIHVIKNNYHRLLSDRFPFAVYYTKENNTVKIQAVLDCRKDPKWIKKKLN